VHGLFTDDRQRAHWMGRIGAATSAFRYEEDCEATLDGLAQHLERHLDCDAILELARSPRLKD
jgi:adenosylcobyric acid synthase